MHRLCGPNAFNINILRNRSGCFIISCMKRLNAKQIWALAIFATALLIRLIYFFQVKANFPGWDSLTIDPLYHDLWARQIASGDILGSGPFFRAPFYAYFLGLIYAIFGPSLIAAKMIQHIIGAASCVFIFLFTESYFDRKTAVMAGFLSAFSWVFVYYEDELLLDSLLVLFGILLIWTLIRSAERRSWRGFLVSGLLLGLASITRPNFLAFLPAILIWLVIIFPGEIARTVKAFILVVAGTAILIFPVTLRNIVIGHDNVLIASQGGINFYIGNNSRADGASASIPEFGPTWQYSDAEYLAKKETGQLGQEMKPSVVSSFFYDKGYRYIFGKPLSWMGLMLKKLDLFWNSYEISNNQNIYFYRRFASITKILPSLFWIISPLSLIGLVLVFKKGRKYQIIGYFVIVYMFTVVAFFVNSRFRLPVLPFLIILASFASCKGIDFIRERNPRRIATFAITLIILLPLTNIDFYGISHDSFAMSYFSLGNIYLKKGLSDQALAEYDTALGMAPCVPKAHLNRGVIFFGRGDYEQAEREFDLELSQCQSSPEAHNNLAVLKRLQGDLDSSLFEAREAVREKPQYQEAYINEILALREQGNFAEAKAVTDTLNMLYPNYLPGLYFEGKISAEHGQNERARTVFARILKTGPVDIMEKYDLATIYALQVGYGYSPDKIKGLANYEMGLLEVRAGQPDSALPYFKMATILLPRYAEAWINLALAYDHKQLYKEALLAFKTASELDPNNALIYYDAGLTLGKIGKMQEAAQFFQQALDLKPDFPEAQDKLKLTQSILNSLGKK
jgi:tetratricopeptide (TPR) repeat protein